MYQLPQFTETDRALITDFIKAHPFALLIGNNGYNSVATQIPLLMAEHTEGLRLRGHIMRNTDHYNAFIQNNNVLAVFSGAHCYISAGWYKERGTAGTWNYITVQARGTLEFLDENTTIEILRDLTNHFEHQRQKPEKMEHMSAHYIQSNVKAVAGFELRVSELFPIFKLSQNKDDESYREIVKRLQSENEPGSRQIAQEMIKRRNHLF